MLKLPAAAAAVEAAGHDQAEGILSAAGEGHQHFGRQGRAAGDGLDDPLG
jgi:hypothetical protein